MSLATLLTVALVSVLVRALALPRESVPFIRFVRPVKVLLPERVKMPPPPLVNDSDFAPAPSRRMPEKVSLSPLLTVSVTAVAALFPFSTTAVMLPPFAAEGSLKPAKA